MLPPIAPVRGVGSCSEQMGFIKCCLKEEAPLVLTTCSSSIVGCSGVDASAGPLFNGPVPVPALVRSVCVLVPAGVGPRSFRMRLRFGSNGCIRYPPIDTEHEEDELVSGHDALLDQWCQFGCVLTHAVSTSWVCYQRCCWPQMCFMAWLWTLL